MNTILKTNFMPVSFFVHFTLLFLLGCPRDHLWLLCDIAVSFFQIQWFFYHSASTDVCENTLLKISGPIDFFHILSQKLPLWLQGITQIMTTALTLIFLDSYKALSTNLHWYFCRLFLFAILCSVRYKITEKIIKCY